MTTKRKRVAMRQRRALQDAGFKVRNTRVVRLHTNPEDETLEHLFSKTAVAKALANIGYRIDSEVQYGPTENVADVIAYGLSDRRPIIVELESEFSDEVQKENVRKYYHGPISEVYTLNVADFPKVSASKVAHAREVLGV